MTTRQVPSHYPEEQSSSIGKQTLHFVQQPGDRISSQGIAMLGLGGFLLAWLIAAVLKIHQIHQIVLEFMFLAALPMILANVVFNQTHRRSASGLEAIPKETDWRRCRLKFIGFWGTIFILEMIYGLVPEYSRPFYRFVWPALGALLSLILCFSFPYIIWVDRRMKTPCDGYYHMGLLILGKWKTVDYRELRLFGLGWLVKGFFLPFMLAGLAGRLVVLNQQGLDLATFGGLYSGVINLLYTVDILFGALGYLLTLRVIDSQIESVEPTLLGWVCTISCYIPFSTLIWTYILNYGGKTNWYDWLNKYPVICITWGFLILLLHVIYAWSTCSFGCRFSNLTNRGIITDGPYRYLKHPAYLSKNMAWWLMAVPFVSHNTLIDGLRACICLLLTNFIYGLRAWTEERHLLRDPAYQIYHRWMKEHGLGAQCRILWKKLSSQLSFVPN